MKKVKLTIDTYVVWRGPGVETNRVCGRVNLNDVTIWQSAPIAIVTHDAEDEIKAAEKLAEERLVSVFQNLFDPISMIVPHD